MNVRDDARLAYQALSCRDEDPSGLSRRRFLQAVAGGVAGGAAGGLALSSVEALLPGLLPGELDSALAAGPIGDHDGVLVVIFMYGGNDGLNTLVPYTDANYYGWMPPVIT